MSTLVTPSARSHERIKGRWERDLQAGTRKEWAIYYTKVLFGSPVPYLLLAMCVSLLISRAANEITTWSLAGCVAVYIAADAFSHLHEFAAFRLGSDLLLLGFFLLSTCSALFFSAENLRLEAVASCRWILLAYLLAYTFELFPGLNRLFNILFTVAVAIALYALGQHFSGWDYARQELLRAAPIAPYYAVRGLFNSAEILGTTLSMLLPFAISCFLLTDADERPLRKWVSLAVALLLGVTILWTYHAGIWLAALASLVVLVTLSRRKPWMLLLSFVLVIGTILFGFYDSPGQFWEAQQNAEVARAESQRATINTHVQVWQSGPWLGAGWQPESRAVDHKASNIYFQILSQSGILGLGLYLLFILSFALNTYRLWQEVPSTHQWHRVFVVGVLGSQVAFHVSGLYWSTLGEDLTANFFALLLAMSAYVFEHYSRGVVSDDYAL